MAGHNMDFVAASVGYSTARCLTRLKKLLPEVCSREALQALDAELEARASADTASASEAAV